jgi:phage N-6-adenine-methyltransferase
MTMPAAMTSLASVEWPTPPELFAELDREFGFTLDPCATPENAKCPTFYTAEDNGLVQPWAPHVVFCNPPYGPTATARWVRKAYAESLDCATVVLLIPARVDTRWWHEVIDGRAEVRFLRGRLRFVGAKHPAPFPSAVVIYRPPNVTASCLRCGRIPPGRRDARCCSNACRQKAYRQRRAGVT